jgi:hypothetical protein
MKCSLGYHYCSARGHHENGFKYTLKAADWAMRRHNYEAGFECLKIAASISRATSETNIVLEVLNRTLRDLVKRTEAAAAARAKMSPARHLSGAGAGALIMGLNGRRGAAGTVNGASADGEDAEVVLLRKFRELKTEIDNQLVANEAQLAAQRMQQMNDSNAGAGNNNNTDGPAGGPPRLGMGKKQISFVSGFGETDNSMMNTPGPLKWQLSFGEMSRIQRQGSNSNINGVMTNNNSNNNSSVSKPGGGIMGMLGNSFKGSMKSNSSSKEIVLSARGRKGSSGKVGAGSVRQTLRNDLDGNGEVSVLKGMNSVEEPVPQATTARCSGCSGGESCVIS